MQPRSPAEQPWAQGERKVALIMGITGQDGSYLAELLLAKGYEVHGSMRRASSFSTGYIEHLHGDAVLETAFRVHLHYSDLTDGSSLVRLLSSVQPTEVYNLGAQSHVKVSFELSVYTAEVDGMGTLRLLDAIRACKLEKKTRLYQASTSELFGRVQQRPQRESTPFHPHSPYGVAKLYAYWMIVNYREAYGMYSCNGILFNHESPRRGETFVTRKISRGVAKISLGQQELIELGNIDSQRDWGHARDYVEAMWLMLQQPEPEDFVIATGEVHSVRKFVEKAFAHVGVAITWEGKGADEVGKDSSTGIVRVRINPEFYRPLEGEFLQGDASKAKRQLGWQPKTSFEEFVKEMVDADLQLFREHPQRDSDELPEGGREQHDTERPAP